MATVNDPKGKWVFEYPSNRLIDFCYEFFTEAGVLLLNHRAASTTSASASGRMLSR
jgi:hypothetical protein